MRFKRNLKPEFGLRQIDIAPMIDLMLLLLIFFMLTTNIVTPSGIRVELPGVFTSNLVTDSTIDVVVTQEAMFINSRAISLDELDKFLASVSKRKVGVLIKADRSVPLSRLVEIWDICKANNISQVNIATKSK